MSKNTEFISVLLFISVLFSIETTVNLFYPSLYMKNKWEKAKKTQKAVAL